MGLIKYLHLTIAAAILGSMLFFTSCSGSGGSGGGGAMFVETCSLGCSNGQTGLQVSCAVSQIFQNQELGVLFSEPVDISTVNSSTFQIINPANSDVPLGSFFLDPSNSKRVIFRPALTLNQMTGQPEFGLDPLTTYLVTIPGVMQGDSPPYIRSATGQVNQSRLQCTVTTTNQTVDLVPGPPQVSVFVDVNNGGGITPMVPADGAVDVSLGTTITMVFDDIMNSATLVDASTGTSNFIRVEIDEDGLILDPSDRSSLPGFFTIVVDEIQLRTTVRFTPNSGLCSGGSGAIPRKVVVTFPPAIQDLSGNSLFNAGEQSFTPEIVAFPAVALPDIDGENFLDSLNEDGSRSSAVWSNGNVRLGFTSGGSGRLGDLRVLANQTVIIDTDSQIFPLPDNVAGNFTGQENDIMSNMTPGVDYDPTMPLTWPSINVTDGIFEFASLRIEGGGRVIFRGSNPARIQVRGEAFIGGVLDVSGVSPGAHDSQSMLGQPGGAGGSGGGSGGDGGDRYDHSQNIVAMSGVASPFTDLVCKGGQGHDMCVECIPGGDPMDPTFCVEGTYAVPFVEADLDGGAGEGVGLAAAGSNGGAPGGVHWPPLFPTQASPASLANFRDLDYNRVFTPMFGFDINDLEAQLNTCINLQVGGTGGGGVYGRGSTPSDPRGFFGELGMFTPDFVSTGPASEILFDEDVTMFPPTGVNNDNNVPAATPPGDQLSIGIDIIVQELSPFLGFLRGGAGGGGGGTSLFGTTSDQFFGQCKNAVVLTYRDNSGAAGGGGGGAVQLHSGTRVTVGGTIDATGGDGGNSVIANVVDSSSAAPGGGGSGGGILIQAPFIDIAPVPGSLNVSGGDGGIGINGSVGGAGGAGLVRLEDKTGTLDAMVEAMKLLPFDPLIPDSNDILSVGNFGAPRARPESISASVSCWMRPTGAFCALGFAEDDLTDPDPANHTYGWNMMLRIDTTPGSGTTIQLEPYRGPNGILADSFEVAFGNMLNHGMPAQTGSPVAVRFQGARLKNPGAVLCDLDLNGPDQDIVAGSLTPWVNHPAELNAFSPIPEMIRFTILFDRDVAPATLDMVKGATDLIIFAQPD